MGDFPVNVAEQLRRLEAMKSPELRALWHATFNAPHPGWVQRDFLVAALAYHFQEKAYGGLSPALERRLRVRADDIANGRGAFQRAQPKIKPGTRLVREWRGETHIVTTHPKDFEYRGKRYGSLSEIARAITRTRWSGPAFFGLKGPSAAKNATRA